MKNIYILLFTFIVICTTIIFIGITTKGDTITKSGINTNNSTILKTHVVKSIIDHGILQ